MKGRPKNIVVIGGASGIGLATVKMLLQNDVEHIVIASRSEKRLREITKEINDDRIVTEPFDISIITQQNVFIEKVNKRISTYVDGVVISSGLNFDGGNWRGFNISEDDYDRIMNTNLKGVFFLIRNYANFMHARKIK